MTDFACARCGLCCKETLSTLDDNVFGIYLEPSEISKFPKEMVFPLFGNGDPVEVIAYQLGVNRCPNYSELNGIGSCRIYNDRPIACATFPVVSNTRVDDRCPAIRNAIDGINRSSLKSELNAFNKRVNRAIFSPGNYMWPLNKCKWIAII